LVKGETPYERDICYEVFDHYDVDRVAYYGAQYFTYGYRFPALLERIQEIAVEYDPDDILMIGLQSENLLPRLPPAVSGAAGQRWLRVTDVGSEPAAAVVRQYEQWAADGDGVTMSVPATDGVAIARELASELFR